MYGVGPTGSGAQALNRHVLGAAGNPLLSADRVNTVTDSGDLGDNLLVIIIIMLLLFTIWMCDRVIYFHYLFASTAYHPATCTSNSTGKCIHN